MAKYIIDVPDEGKYRLGQAYIFANDGERLVASCNLTDLTPYTEPYEDEIRQKVINEICSKFAANEYYYGDALKSAFICMAEGKEIGQVECFCLGEAEDRIKQKVEDEVWKFVRKLTHPCNGGLYENEKKEIFDKSNSDSVLIGMSYQEARDKYDKWKRKKEDIHVGDEVETESGNKACVLYENPDGTQMFVFKADGTAAWWSKCAIHKTGKNHPEIAELLKKMREESDG